MFGWLPNARGAIMAARAVPAAGQLVCVGGSGAVVDTGVMVGILAPPAVAVAPGVVPLVGV